MNDVKKIENYRKTGSDYFRLMFVRISTKKLEYYIKQFNPEEYHILKSTSKFRFISVDDFLEFHYSGYIFFKKELYDKEYIQKWLDFIDNL